MHYSAYRAEMSMGWIRIGVGFWPILAGSDRSQTGL